MSISTSVSVGESVNTSIMTRGYHYTTLSRWQSIQRDGMLKPYKIIAPVLREFIGSESTQGIWIWRKRMEGLSHIGSVLYQMATKNETQVVLLKVWFDEIDCLNANNGDMLLLYHTGSIGNLQYHKNDENETAYIVTKPIDRFELIENFDLMNIGWLRQKS